MYGLFVLLSGPGIVGMLGIFVFLLIIFIMLASKVSKNSSEQKAKKERADDKLRQDSLDDDILNPNGPKKKNILETPSDVIYKQDKGNNPAPHTSKAMVNIVEHHGLSVRTYTLDISTPKGFGSDPNTNSILISGAAPNQCQLFVYNNYPYIRDLADNTTVIHRNGMSSPAGQGVQLMNGDVFVVRDTSFEFSVVV